MSTQHPKFEVVDLYTFSESVPPVGNSSIAGWFSDITNSGTVAGRDVVNGRTVPVLWDPAGQRTILNTDGIDFTGTIQAGVFAQTDTLVAANLEGKTADGKRNRLMAVEWTDGVPELLEPVDDNIVISAMNARGQIAGTVSSHPARWSGSGPEILAADGAGMRINADGVVAGYTRSPGTLPDRHVVLWQADGTVTPLAYPDDLFGQFSAISNLSVDVRHLADDQSVLASIAFAAGNTRVYRTVLFKDGATSYVHGLAGPSALARVANTAGTMYGTSIDEKMKQLFTIWVDSEAHDMNEVVLNTTGLVITGFNAINDAGEMAGMAQDKSGTRHGIVLRPIA
ncbi:MAG: hypothetical protein AB7V46_01840 [Thermomicrobiales bacterium]